MFALNCIAVIICLALASLTCVSGGRPQARIVGGFIASLNEFPHQISLEYNKRLPVCGGTILNARWIITAAHCVTWSDRSVIPAADLTVRAGSNVLSIDGVVAQVKTVIVHDKYGLNLNDVALLELESPLPLSNTIKAIEVREEDVPDNVPVTVYGWGKTSDNGQRSEVLKKNTLTHISQKDCGKRFKMDFPQILCFESPVGEGVCQGDSGGGAIYDNKLIGVASFVKGGCGGKHPDIYARVNKFLDFIQKHVK